MRRKQRSQCPPADTARASAVLFAAAELVVICRRALGTNTGSIHQGESEAHTAGAGVTQAGTHGTPAKQAPLKKTTA